LFIAESAKLRTARGRSRTPRLASATRPGIYRFVSIPPSRPWQFALRGVRRGRCFRIRPLRPDPCSMRHLAAETRRVDADPPRFWAGGAFPDTDRPLTFFVARMGTPYRLRPTGSYRVAGLSLEETRAVDSPTSPSRGTRPPVRAIVTTPERLSSYPLCYDQGRSSEARTRLRPRMRSPHTLSPDRHHRSASTAR